MYREVLMQGLEGSVLAIRHADMQSSESWLGKPPCYLSD